MYEKVDVDAIIGQRFGKLMVTEYDGYRNNKHYYKCLCDCGNNYVSHRGRLIYGGATSCGCDRPHRPNPKELIGKRYGKVTVIEDLGTRRIPTRRVRSYLCCCDCGNTFETTRTRLLNGEVKSCGQCVSIQCEEDHYRYTCMDGDSFIFDAEDLELVRNYRWYMSNGYPVTRSNGGQYRKLTRLILCLSETDDKDVDHIDGNTRNNCRSNLRVSAHSENMRNTKLCRANTSGYKGVCFVADKRRYLAQIVENTRYHFLGYYDNPIDAARAYDEAARFYFGEFACVNFPQPGEQGCMRNQAVSDKKAV